MTTTTCPVFTADEWAQRLLTMFPNRWTGDTAKATGGVLYSWFATLGTQFMWLQNELLYAFEASRVATAVDEALDRAANDFFGPTNWSTATVVRQAGESDTAFRARIFASMFTGGATRRALINLIKNLTGSTPRFIEPWLLTDCAVIDHSFIDYDNPSVNLSGRISNSALIASSLVEGQLPSAGGINYPIFGIDYGSGIDVSYIIDVKLSDLIGAREIDALINTKKAQGTHVYIKWLRNISVLGSVASTRSIPAGTKTINVGVNPAFPGPYVVIAEPSWNTTVKAIRKTNSTFVLEFGTPPSTPQICDWLAAPLTLSGFGQIPVTAGAEGAGFAIPTAFSGGIIVPMCNWESTVWQVDSFAPVGDVYTDETAQSQSISQIVVSDDGDYLFVSWYDSTGTFSQISKVRISDMSVVATQAFGGVNTGELPIRKPPASDGGNHIYTFGGSPGTPTLYQLNTSDLSIAQSVALSSGSLGDYYDCQITPDNQYVYALWAAGYLPSYTHIDVVPISTFASATPVQLATDYASGLSNLFDRRMLIDPSDNNVWFCKTPPPVSGVVTPVAEKVNVSTGAVMTDVSLTPISYSAGGIIGNGDGVISAPNAVSGDTVGYWIVDDTFSTVQFAYVFDFTTGTEIAQVPLPAGGETTGNTNVTKCPCAAIDSSYGWFLQDNFTTTDAVLRIPLDGTTVYKTHTPALNPPEQYEWSGMGISPDGTRLYVASNVPSGPPWTTSIGNLDAASVV